MSNTKVGCIIFLGLIILWVIGKLIISSTLGNNAYFGSWWDSNIAMPLTIGILLFVLVIYIIAKIF